MTKIISVVNQKGGTGKTTTALNLGCSLAAIGHTVMLVDLDPQANLTYALGVQDPSYTLADVLSGDRTIEDSIVEIEGLALLPGSMSLVNVELALVNYEDRETYLKKALENVTGYDYIIIDAPPSLSLLALNALCAADEVVIPLQPEVLTYQGVSQVLNTISQVQKGLNRGLKVHGILLVMYDKRKKLTLEMHDFLKKNVEEKIFKSIIRSNVKIAESPSFGMSVIKYAPLSNGAKDYMALAKEISKSDKADSKRIKKQAVAV